MSRLKMTVDFSASLTRSLKLWTAGVADGEGDATLLACSRPPAAGPHGRGWRPQGWEGRSELRALGTRSNDTICDGCSESLSISESEGPVAAAAAKELALGSIPYAI